MTVIYRNVQAPQAQPFPLATYLVHRRHSAGDDNFSRRSRGLSDSPLHPSHARRRLSDRYHGRDVCTSWPSSLTPNANCSPANSSVRLFDHFLDLRRTIKNLKDQISQARLRWQNAQEQLFNKFKLHHESAQELMSSLPNVLDIVGAAVFVPKFPQLQQRCSHNLRDIEVQKYICWHFGQELGSLESRLTSREQEVDAILTRLCDAIGIVMEDKHNDQDSCAIFDPDIGELPPLLLEFYHRSGDVGIQGDRLEDLDVEHEQALEREACLGHIGDALNLADGAMQREYEQRRAKILSDLAAAQHDVGVLSQACQAVGIDTEARRYVFSSESCSLDGAE